MKVKTFDEHYEEITVRHIDDIFAVKRYSEGWSLYHKPSEMLVVCGLRNYLKAIEVIDGLYTLLKDWNFESCLCVDESTRNKIMEYLIESK